MTPLTRRQKTRLKEDVDASLTQAWEELDRGNFNNTSALLQDAAAKINYYLAPKYDLSQINGHLSLHDPTISSSLLRGFQILQVMEKSHGPLGVYEIGARLEMPNSTVHRYLRTLAVVGLVTRDPVTRKYKRATWRTPQ